MKKQNKQSAPTLQDILNKGEKTEIRSLFGFTSQDTADEVLLKFSLWARYFFPNYFKAPDAIFHRDIDRYNLAAYRGEIDSFTDIVFRGGAKTSRTKLFLGFAIANDREHLVRYIKVLTKDYDSAKKITTDIYNMFVNERVRYYYPEILEKVDDLKREKTMSSFQTSTGVQVTAGTVGTDQRGHLQEDARPNLILFDDFETRKTLRSAVETQSIWDNMEEARTGLAKGGACIYNCNYISERGNVHRLVEKESERAIVTIVPIVDEDGKPAWDYYSKEDIDAIRKQADDFEGEYLCQPSAGHDVFFDRATVDLQIPRTPIKEVAGFKMFYPFNPSHRYGSGHDVAGGVGLDSSTSVFIDFTVIPNRVVATFKSNTIKPDIFGDEIARQAGYYGEPIVAVENNKYDMAVGRLKQIYSNLFNMEMLHAPQNVVDKKARTYGWRTDGASKPTMLFEMGKAVADGLLDLTDPDLIAEAKSYTRDDLMDRDVDVRLATRHFDLLIACAIAWQMRHFAVPQTHQSTISPGFQTVDLDPYQ